ncbi:hypothetical protein GEMRC1_000497 [Eukaryota sp. GEM-RC1]
MASLQNNPSLKTQFELFVSEECEHFDPMQSISNYFLSVGTIFKKVHRDDLKKLLLFLNNKFGTTCKVHNKNKDVLSNELFDLIPRVYPSLELVDNERVVSPPRKKVSLEHKLSMANEAARTNNVSSVAKQNRITISSVSRYRKNLEFLQSGGATYRIKGAGRKYNSAIEFILLERIKQERSDFKSVTKQKLINWALEIDFNREFCSYSLSWAKKFFKRNRWVKEK